MGQSYHTQATLELLGGHRTFNPERRVRSPHVAVAEVCRVQGGDEALQACVPNFRSGID